MNRLYTIGYANKSIEEFINLLKSYNINCIVDVRSMPFSKQYPLYNEMELKKCLSKYNIKYLSFKKEFGARRDEHELYSEITTYENNIIEVVDFKKVWNHQNFDDGVKRVLNGLNKSLNICFLCSEKYAYDCHRGIMVAEYFFRKGYKVDHIVDNSNLIEHEKIETFLHENFIKAKNKFEKIHATQLNELQYASNLFGINLIDEYIIFWKDFFKIYSREKAFELRNYEIGYRKGNNEDE